MEPMADWATEAHQIKTHRLKHRVLEQEELQLQSILDNTTPAPFLTTVLFPVGGKVVGVNSVTEAHQTKLHPP
jgi:hypothetical protein